MADFKPPLKRQAPLPSLFKDIGSTANLPRGNHWLGFEISVLARNTKVVDRSADYLDARTRQSDSYTALIDARMRIARKLAELVDLPNVLAEDQRKREHERVMADEARVAVRIEAVRTSELGKVRHETELARLHEARVRSERNLQAALRVKDAQLDQWYAEAQARTNNAKAECEDTAADLAYRPAGDTACVSPDAAARQRAHDLAMLDRQIELERGRGNEAAVLALLNLKALLQGA